LLPTPRMVQSSRTANRPPESVVLADYFLDDSYPPENFSAPIAHVIKTKRRRRMENWCAFFCEITVLPIAHLGFNL
jgi:hypothetical protein